MMRALPNNGRCIESHLLAMDLYATKPGRAIAQAVIRRFPPRRAAGHVMWDLWWTK
jgi:hypothetical protein